MRKIEDVVIDDEVWASITLETLQGDHTIEEQSAVYGHYMADCVATGQLPVTDLRKCVRWANELNREVIEIAKREPVSEFEDLLEFLGRQILQASTKIALDKTKSRRRRLAHSIDYERRRQLLNTQEGFGMFRLEAKDLGLSHFAVVGWHGTLGERLKA